MEKGHYGEFRVFVDDEEVLAGGPLAFLGLLPSVSEIKKAVSQKAPRAHERTTDTTP